MDDLTTVERVIIWVTAIIVTSAIILFILYLQLGWGDQKQDLYCGNVVEKFRTDAGYKSSPEAHVVLYCEKLKRNLDVKVSWNTYANAYIGKNICFKLRLMDIDN